MIKDFSTLGVKEEFTKVLAKNGINEPTPIQEQTIPLLFEGRDVTAEAQTGTGKTLAFLLPMMEKIDLNKHEVQGLIITPTRELALQITAEIRKLVEAKRVNMLAVYGGQDVERQIKKLQGTIHIVVGTPGRILDHVRRKTVNFNNVSMLVLDEADQMLDMGFLPDIEHILKQTSPKRQTMLCSATMPKGIRTLSVKYMTRPHIVRIQSKNVTLDEIKQIVIETTDRNKQDALIKIIEETNPFMAVIFCRTKRRAKTLNEALQMKGFNSDELHGDLSQAKRENVMSRFRKVKVQFLIATDVAARGLDIEGITHVFNYDIPLEVESYIHRIGRTGRAGQEGMAITFVSPKDRILLDAIEKGIRTKLEKRKLLIEDKFDPDEVVRPRKVNKYGNAVNPRSKGRNPRFSTGKASGPRKSSNSRGKAPRGRKG